MTKEQFIEKFGEDPVDILGEDWQNYLDDYLHQQGQEEFGMEYEGQPSPIVGDLGKLLIKKKEYGR